MGILKDIFGFLPFTGYILAFILGGVLHHYGSLAWAKIKVSWQKAKSIETAIGVASSNTTSKGA